MSKLQRSNKRFRWNLIWFFLFCLGLVPLPLWLYPLHCLSGYLFIAGITAWICIVLLLCMIQASYTMGRLLLANKPDKQKKPDVEIGDGANNENSTIHVVLMAAYKEPLDVMVKTVDSLKAQTVAKQIYFIVGFEERTPDYEAKCAWLRSLYSDAFFDMFFTRHPSGVEGEIPGKCSNANYSTREAVKQLEKFGIRNLDDCIFTTCDTDNLFPIDYFERLGDEYRRCERRHEVIWQPPLFYNYDLDKRPFFVRVTGIFRMVFILGMLIPQNINAMSVYSLSVRLLIRSGYFHPGYQFVDAIDNLVRMIAVGRNVPLKLLPCPVISGPTSGVNLGQEITEWGRQAWRWTIGTTEIFHYFCIKWRRLSCCSALAYGLAFTHYYGFVICAMALICVTGLVSTNVFDAVGVCNPSDYLPKTPYTVYLTNISLIGIAFAYVMFAWCFVLDAIATRRLLNIHEDISFVRNIAHWLSTPFVLLAYSAVGYYATVELAIRGKQVCTHGASKKAGLATVINEPSPTLKSPANGNLTDDSVFLNPATLNIVDDSRVIASSAYL